MNRQIKFRAWNKVDKKGMIDLKKITPLITSIDGVFLPFDDNIILMQFTGLKDKNGKEIYEGDIVLDKEINRLVKWSSQNASFYMGHTDKDRLFYKEFIACGQSQGDGPVMCDTIEIIGNIYEHPELIS